MRKLPILLIILSVMSLTSCKKSKYTGDNPLLAEWETPFGIPPFAEITPEHYKPALIEGMERQLAEIDSIVGDQAAPDFTNTILALDNSGELYGRVSRIFSLLCSAETNDQLKLVEQEMSPMMTKHDDDIYLNDRLFAKVKTVYDARLTSGMDSLQIRLTEKTYDKFVRAGTGLNEQDKQKLRKINEDLTVAQVKFGNNLLEATNNFVMLVDSADVETLPFAIKEAAAKNAESRKENGRFAFTLDKPSLLPFLMNSPREDLREKLYRGYLERCQAGSEYDNTAVVNEIVRLRTERAKLLGFKTHADYMLRERMAKDPKNVYGLLDEIWGPALKLAKSELEEMRKLKEEETGNTEFNSWDWWYYAEKVRKNNYALDEEMLKPYFSLASVQAGIFDLCNRLYKITFRPINNAPVYHKDCSVYEVLDADNKHLAVLIMDFFPRPGKRGGAWCGSYRPRKYMDGVKVSDPIVTIVCNFSMPTDAKPALLTLDETETFFHEFGHAVHSFFTDVPYLGLQRVERDFVELPSQIMENWAFEPQMLRRYAMHYSNDTPIPDHLITKISNSSKFNMGFMTTELIAASYTDMDIYNDADFKPVNLRAFEIEMLNDRRGLIPEIEPRYRFPYFQHIFKGGYSAGYYGYIWAEVLDKDAYEAFVESGDIFNDRIAASFRDNILKKGGSADGADLYRSFRGRDADRKPLMYARGLLERPAPVIDDVIPMVELETATQTE